MQRETRLSYIRTSKRILDLGVYINTRTIFYIAHPPKDCHRPHLPFSSTFPFAFPLLLIASSHSHHTSHFSSSSSFHPSTYRAVTRSSTFLRTPLAAFRDPAPANGFVVRCHLRPVPEPEPAPSSSPLPRTPPGGLPVRGPRLNASPVSPRASPRFMFREPELNAARLSPRSSVRWLVWYGADRSPVPSLLLLLLYSRLPAYPVSSLPAPPSLAPRYGPSLAPRYAPSLLGATASVPDCVPNSAFSSRDPATLGAAHLDPAADDDEGEYEARSRGVLSPNIEPEPEDRCDAPRCEGRVKASRSTAAAEATLRLSTPTSGA